MRIDRHGEGVDLRPRGQFIVAKHASAHPTDQHEHGEPGQHPKNTRRGTGQSPASQPQRQRSGRMRGDPRGRRDDGPHREQDADCREDHASQHEIDLGIGVDNPGSWRRGERPNDDREHEPKSHRERDQQPPTSPRFLHGDARGKRTGQTLPKAERTGARGLTRVG